MKRPAGSLRQTIALVTLPCFVLALTVGPLAPRTAIAKEAPPAKAPPKRVTRVALVDVDGNTHPESTDLHYFVEKGIRIASKNVVLQAIDDVLNSGAQAKDIQNVAFGKDALEAGMKAYGSGKCDEAADQLEQAVTFFESSFAFLDDPEDYFRALLHQGICLWRTGQKEPAKLVIARALIVEPELDIKQFKAEQALFDAANELLRDKAITSVTVASIPPGSRVFVDGGYRGVAPVFRPGLREGVHFVRVERQGYARVGKKVTPKGDDSGNVKVEIELQAARKKAVLEGLLPGLQKEFGQPTAGKTVAQLQGTLLVDYVVLFRASGEADKKKVDLTLYSLTSGRLLAQKSLVVDWTERSRESKDKVIELARQVLDVDLQEAVTIQDGPTTPVPESGGIHTKWWFWTIIGVVVAGGAVGLGVALSRKKDAPEGTPSDGSTGGILLRF